MTTNQIIILAASLGAGVGAIVAFVLALVNSVKTHKVKEALDQSKKRGTYFICPHCKKAVTIKEVDFILPGGSIDNNLNGIPDDQESDAFARISPK